MSEINYIDRSAKNRQIDEREEACHSAQIALAQRACKAAERVADAASRQATAAEQANSRATIALAIAIISMIVTGFSIWMTFDTFAHHAFS
jgi:F0F1-type ATP synthase assembly protein I